MEDLKLESWQTLTIQSLAAERERLAKRIQGINVALGHYAEEWAAGLGGLCEFDARADGLYLVMRHETELAPAP